MSAIISAASPEKKMGRNTKLRATSGTTNIYQQSSPLDLLEPASSKTNEILAINALQKFSPQAL